MSGHVPEGLTADQAEAYKNKKYMKVFFALCAFTVLEVIPVLLPLPKGVQDLIVICFTITKAFFVGYFFMHLEFETKWTRIIACLPIMMLFYAAVLMPDTIRSRPLSLYVPTPERVFPASHHAEEAVEGHGEEHATEGHAEEHAAAPEAPAAPAAHAAVPAELPDTESAERAAAAKVVAALKEQAAIRTGAAKATAPTEAPAAGAGASTPAASSTGGNAEVDQWR